MNWQFNDLYKKWVAIDFVPQKTCEYEIKDQLLNDEIVIVDSCYFFKSLAPEIESTSEKWYDRTGIECDFNNISIEDIIDVESVTERLNYGLCFAYNLAKKLESQFGQDFNVILSYDRENCFVRFHKIRAGEKWLDDNLNNYKIDAVLKIVT